MPIKHITELFSLHGAEFIHAAYAALLQREPDPHGLNYYLGRLAQGYSKASIIAQLAKAPESQPHSRIDGLTKLLKDERKAQHWFWGLFVNRARQARAQSALAYPIAITTPPAIDYSPQFQAISEQLAHLNLTNGRAHEVNVPIPKASNLSRQTVLDLFSLILGRSPESEETIWHHAELSSPHLLKTVLMASDEFHLRLIQFPEYDRSIFKQQINAQFAYLQE
ncbi:MAG: DUF4214 domain-containing protein [Halothiobacillaceae bacterium]